jgi:hypothetical protein
MCYLVKHRVMEVFQSDNHSGSKHVLCRCRLAGPLTSGPSTRQKSTKYRKWLPSRLFCLVEVFIPFCLSAVKFLTKSWDHKWVVGMCNGVGI